MRIPDEQHGMEFDLSDGYCMKISSLFHDRARIATVKEKLIFNSGSSQESSLNFSVEEKPEGYLIVRGSLIGVIAALEKEGLISEGCKKKILPILEEDLINSVAKLSAMLSPQEVLMFAEEIRKLCLQTK